jgi:hypothetical protein
MVTSRVVRSGLRRSMERAEFAQESVARWAEKCSPDIKHQPSTIKLEDRADRPEGTRRPNPTGLLPTKFAAGRAESVFRHDS